MQRKEAEKLLAALIFDDLDEASKTELLNYLQTDNELRERLADMRMAVKVASDTVQQGPDPVLGKRRLKRLARLARGHRTQTTFFTVPRLVAAAAIFIIAALALNSIQQTDKAKVALSDVATKYEVATQANERDFADHLRHSESPGAAPSRGDQAIEITSITGKYAYDSGARGPEVVDSESVIKLPMTVINGQFQNDGRLFAKKEIRGISNAQIPVVSGYVPIDTSSELGSEQTTEITSTTGQYAFDTAVRGPEVVDSITGMNDNALIQKQTLEDRMRRQIEAYRKKSKVGIDVPRKADEASIPYAGDITYPDNWQEIIASPYRKPEEPLGQDHYALEPPARGREVVDSESGIKLPMTVINGHIWDDGRLLAKAQDEIGGITGIQPSSGPGDAQWSRTFGLNAKLDSGSSWDSKPHSGKRGDDDYVSIDSPDGDGIMGRLPGGGYGGGFYAGGYGVNRSGDINGRLPGGGMGFGGGGFGGGGFGGGGYGGMGGYGGGGYGGGGFGRGGYGGMGGGGYGKTGGYRGTRYGWDYGDMGGYGDGSGYGSYVDMSGGNGKTGSYRRRSFNRQGGDNGVMNGVMDGDTLVVSAGTYDGDIDIKGKEIRLFSTNPDDPEAVAKGIVADGRFTLQNGKAVGIKKEGLEIDSLDAYTDKDGGRKPVVIDSIMPVTVTKPDDSGIVAIGEAVGGSVFFQNGHAASIKNIEIATDNFVLYGDNDPSPFTVDAGQPVTFTKPEPALRTRRSFGLDVQLGTSTKPESASQLQPMRDVSGITDLPDIKLHTEGRESHVDWEGRNRDKWSVDSGSLEARNRETRNKIDALFWKSDDELVNTSYHYLPKKAKPPVLATGGTEEGRRQGDASREADLAAIPYSKVISSTDTEKYIVDFMESAKETKSLLKKGQSAGRDSSAPAEGPAGKEESRRRTVPILGDLPLVGGLFRTEKKRSLTDEEKSRIVAHLKDGESQPEGESEIAAILTQPEPVVKYRIDVRSADDSADIPIEEVEIDLPPASRFKLVPVNPWVMSERDPFSTFALDVDTASYTLCRRYIHYGFQPPAGAVRMEEFVNYFNYQYPQRTNPTFKVHAEAAPSPFARKDQNLTLLKIGVKARTIGRDQRKAAHLIFVVDASASMGQPDRLPFVQQALDLLVGRLSNVDRVSLITCANEARLHLESTSTRERNRIRQAIYAIQPAGSTNLLAGLKLGYATARRSFAPKQINHVILCSDGVANVGQTEAEAVLSEVAADRKQGITITCVGVGYGSYNDVFLEALANRGDGSYMFLDSARQAQRVFVEQLAATLQTVAKDARIQVDFNPNRVRRYRLIGYENRDIEDKRFRDDTIDAGEVGSGQCSTALYELELIGQPSADRQEDLGTVFVRYRNVETGQIEEISSRLSSAIVQRRTVASAPRFFLAAGAARFAEMLRQSEHAQHGNMMDVLRVVEQVSLALPLDRDVRELAELIRRAEHLPRSP